MFLCTFSLAVAVQTVTLKHSNYCITKTISFCILSKEMTDCKLDPDWSLLSKKCNWPSEETKKPKENPATTTQVNRSIKIRENIRYPARSDSGDRSRRKTGWSRSRSVAGRDTATGWHLSYVCGEWARSGWAPWSQSPVRCPHHRHWWPSSSTNNVTLREGIEWTDYREHNISIYYYKGTWK